MAIEIIDVTKYYGKKPALKNINLTLDKGIYALLGSNGAGKSTLLNILVTSLSGYSGQVLFNGTDIKNKKSDYLDKLGYLPQSPRFYKNYTSEEFLKYMAALKGIGKIDIDKRIGELLEFVNLSEERHKKIGSFSGGMVQRIGIAQALINNPEILILDEPTAGLDPIERIRLRNLISNISKNKTVIIATHIVSDIEFIANRVILLKNGVVCKNDTPEGLTREFFNRVWLVKTDETGFNMLSEKEKISNIHLENNVYYLKIISDKRPFAGAEPVEPSMEDVFLAVN